MRKYKTISGICGMVLGVTVVISGFMIGKTDVNAAHDIKATVSGTVQSGSNSNTLNLKTTQGDMVIKIDSDTTMDTKIMTPGATLYVDVYYGSDAYMHADKISSVKTDSAEASNIKTSTITGKVADKAMSDNILYVDVNKEQMQLKIDASTNLSGCGMLYAGKSITAEVYRGDDAYMHAYSISDGNGESSSSDPTNTAIQSNTKETTEANKSETPADVSTTAITGKIGAESNKNCIYLQTNEGSYTLKVDSNTKFSGGYMLVEGTKVVANVYRGDDAYMHVASISRTGKLSSTSEGSSTMSFSGRVNGETTDGTLYLRTSGGTMTIRLDEKTKCNSPVFKNSLIAVNCVNCEDGYWHATSISVN